ncbi:unnamed protein product [Rhizoctonia solani]|uniref:O-methylsterigmatocystin oxidoreductase n=1 Tax=Rhizoctonia solani TaxID=456999 RepID=A0A8H2X5J5_9AGAM|nr:unnamed protein product [Rhizoctonia solani]
MIDLNNRLNVFGITLGAALSLHLLVRRVLEFSKPPLPPSPRSYPLIGHLFSMPKSNEHLGFIELGKQLKTDIFSLTVFGQTMIVLNSVEEAIKLLQNRSGIYSDRPRPVMLTEPSLMDAGKIMIERPGHARALSGTLLRSIYGYQIHGGDDPILKEAVQLVHNLSDAVMPTNFLVNIFPSLRHFPTWLPGAGWKRVAHKWREQKENIVRDLYNKAKAGIASGNHEPNIVASSLATAEDLGIPPEEVDDYLSHAGITLYLAGAETTSNVFLVFAIVMMLYPEVQRKAQAEIDSLLGDSRLPVMDDLHQLPYTNCVIQEVLRWCPVVPTGVPHAATSDDLYQGFRIPKGAIVFANIWAMSRNEKVYHEPEKFNPDRFLDPSVPPCPIFGFGRRECPGNHFAGSSIFIVISSFLALFNFRIPKRTSGEEIVPELTCKNTMIYHPDEFLVKLELRSPRRASLARAMEG